ncbi:MAG: hypothetical protein PHV85_10620 [Desulfovibrionaceae bacterium]|nr:hypothetical protein [Desulfovibrionaceae bacterium]MDD4952991.1 hypothetical protein [Desulfovibrionaceae bacterium]
MNPQIGPHTTVLDAVSRWPSTEEVFRRAGERAGACILCVALFETLGWVAERYELDLDELILDLERAADKGPGPAAKGP